MVELTAPKAFELHQTKPRRRVGSTDQAIKRTYLNGGPRAKSESNRIDWRKPPKVVPAMTKKYDQLVQANKAKRFLKHNETVRRKLVEEEKKRRRAEVVSQ